MSKYFNAVHFYMPDDPGEPAKRVERRFFDLEKLATAVAEIQAEFERIRAGTSEHTSYPIDPGDFGFPAANRLKILEMDPCKKNYLAFLEISKQDLGQRVAVHFMGLLKEAQVD